MGIFMSTMLGLFRTRRTPDSPFAASPSTEVPMEGIDAASAILCDEIRAFNPSVSMGYLATFDRASLELYLNHLTNARLPRGPGSRWVRPGDTPAMVLRQTRD